MGNRNHDAQRESEIQRLQDEQGKWSDATFGVKRDPRPALHHLRKEVREVIRKPFDTVEYADCLMLLLDAYRKVGGSADELVQVAFAKLDINREREWGDPDQNGVVEHVRKPSGSAAQ
ncbi:MAG: dATP/dGTP pyrophosphohydrolase domain-containing protein [Aquisalimonadaceae bacterium]